ncbi:MAG: hypothetical protein HOK89_12300 [Rhodospirillaceae bacterium]|jgi:hypothetical protein|nr:hypothetical protein [Rhodospirillaceae bacterium]
MSETIKTLLNSIGLSQTQFSTLFPTVTIEGDDQLSYLKLLDAYMESLIIDEIDYFSNHRINRIILIRFLNDEDFSLYEPEIFDILRSYLVHNTLITRTKKAIERTKKDVDVVYMASSFYETWLGVNDFDDRRDLRITWAQQQLRG